MRKATRSIKIVEAVRAHTRSFTPVGYGTRKTRKSAGARKVVAENVRKTRSNSHLRGVLKSLVHGSVKQWWD